jgi:putative heme-binding domain-containing protein
VESILLPNAKISPLFRATTITTQQGKVFTGLVVSETAEQVELIVQDTTRQKIAKAEIDQRTLQDISPMPAGLVTKPDELRDLLAYLLRPDGKPR